MAKQKIPHLSCEDVVPLEDLIRDALTAQADEGKAMAGFRYGLYALRLRPMIVSRLPFQAGGIGEQYEVLGSWCHVRRER